MDMLHDDAVLQASIRTQFFPHCFTQQRHVMLLEPFVKELGRDLNRQHLSIQLDRFDGSEPRLVCLGTDVVFDDRQALGPDTRVVEVHVESGKGLKII